MKISIHTTITNPEEHQFPWKEALESFCAAADEVIVVNGGKKLNLEIGNPKIKEIMYPWPDEWHWSEMVKHVNRGLDECTGDWAIKTDIDYVFHEKDIPNLRYALEEFKNYSVASIIKIVVMSRHRNYTKIRLPFCINKKESTGTIRYGRSIDQDSAWGYPIFRKGEEDRVPFGPSVMEGIDYQTGVPIWNYDYFFRTVEQCKYEFWRIAKAYKTVFGPKWGGTEEKSWRLLLNQMKMRSKFYLTPVSIDGHPKFIRERIRNMKPEEFGYDNWNNFKNL